MKDVIYTNQEISSLISSELRKREWSIRRCCDEFNRTRSSEINSGKIYAMDKDFIQRIKSNNFKVLSKRVADLCIFLDINLCSEKEIQIEQHLKDEFLLLENAVNENPTIKQDLKSILFNLSIVIQRGSLDEVY